MKKLSLTFILLISLLNSSFMPKPKLYPELQTYCKSLKKEFSLISAERKQNLEAIAQYILAKAKTNEKINLLYICTHNSRRSQFGQVWANVAAYYYGLKNVNTFSGGTEVTAFNQRAADALSRVGFKITSNYAFNNPKLQIGYSPNEATFYMYSKKYNDLQNPQSDFCAILVCSQADESCPIISGASKRVYHGYEDPKHSDGKQNESQVYDETCRLIAREMFYVFDYVSKQI